MISNSIIDINHPSTSGISSNPMHESGSDDNSTDYEESELFPRASDSDSVSLISCPTFSSSENDINDEEMIPPMLIEPEEREKNENPMFEGRRIFDVKYLFEQLSEINNHQPFSCGINEMQAIKEIRHGPGKFTKDYVQRKHRENINLKRRRLTYCRYNKENKKLSNADEHYGGNQDQPDMDTDLYEKKKDQFMKNITDCGGKKRN
ncbi:hypothetical protein CBL_11580 [Carabus blaptoides fortunei]